MTELKFGALCDGSAWAERSTEMDEVFAPVRSTGCPHFVKSSDAGNTKGDYWALTRHADIVDVSKRPREFSSGAGVTIEDGVLLEGLFIQMDDPLHTRLRRIVSRGFTPRSLDGLRSDVARIASETVAAVAGRGSCDFVEDIAVPIPTRVICSLVGVPLSDHQFVVDQSNRLLSPFEPAHVPDQTDAGRLAAKSAAAEGLSRLASELATERLANPKDDLVSMLVTKNVDGEALTPKEVADFFTLLIAAGLETTRNAIAHGLLALTQHPEQRDLWMSDFHGHASTAVEEILRWASPVLHMRRTVTADGVKVGDTVMSAGDKVVMWYYSANRDPEVFEEPLTFDVTRKSKEQISFGAPGIHYCLGAHLARREISATFEAIFEQIPDIAVTGPPEWVASNFLNGMKHLPVSYTPPGRSSV
jgi:cytochrome P450